MESTRDVVYPLLETFVGESVVYLVIDYIAKANMKRSRTEQAKRKVVAVEGCFLLLASVIAIVTGRLPVIMLAMAVGCFLASASTLGVTYKDVERPFLRKVEKMPLNGLLNPHRPRPDSVRNAMSGRPQAPGTDLGLGSDYGHQGLSRRPLRSQNIQSSKLRPLTQIPPYIPRTNSVNRSATPFTASPLSVTQDEKAGVEQVSRYSNASSVWSIPWWQRYGFTSLFNYQAHHPPGIANRSTNTCFLNACLQCIARSPRFLTTISVKSVNQDVSESVSVVSCLRDLMQQLVLPKENWKFGHLCNIAFRQAAHLVRPGLIASPEDGYQQQNDAGEFLIWLLDTVHETMKASSPSDDAKVEEKLEGMVNFANRTTVDQLRLSLQNGHKFSESSLKAVVNACNLQLSTLGYDAGCQYYLPLQLLSASEWALYWKRDSSVVTSLFTGQLMEARLCLNCQRLSASAEAFVLLPVPVVSPTQVHQPTQLMDCLRRFGRVERLTSEENLWCLCNSASGSDKNMRVSGDRRALFSVLPDCLNIQLQRFSYNIDYGVVEKNHSPVDFPLDNLDLTSLTLDTFLQSASSQRCRYSLYGVCVHLGSQSASCGHYVAYCLCDEDGKWYRFDDEYVREADMVKEKSWATIRENAYLLFYRKIS